MAEATRAEVYAAIDSEREYQDKKWDGRSEPHELSSWILWMEQYLLIARKAATEDDPAHALDAIRKATALGVACMEDHGAPKRT